MCTGVIGVPCDMMCQVLGCPRNYSRVWIIEVSMSNDGMVIAFSVRRDSHGWNNGMAE